MTQLLDVAEGVLVEIAQIRCPSVMAAFAMKLETDPDGVQGFVAAFGMDARMGQG